MIHNIIMPDLGQTVAEGKILRWLKRPGDVVSRGEALLEVETDKVTMEVESYRSGYLRAILVGEGEMASAMSAIAVLTDQFDEIFEESRHRDIAKGGADREGTVGASKQVSASARSAGGAVQNRDGRVLASPAARLRARELGVDLRSLVASRPDGLITRRDVNETLATRATSRPAHPMATITTKSAQSIPHFYVTVDTDLSTALVWREQWNSEHPDARLTLNDVFVRAASLALRDLPSMNVRYSHGMIEQRSGGDVLLVVATTSRGLSWIPLADPASVGWSEHAGQMRRALKSAEDGLPPSLLAAGAPALALSNLGMFGVRQFTAIVPPDSTAILAIGAVREEPIVRNRQIEIGERCALTLAADHRAVDGMTAAKFLEQIQVHLKSL
jgi:pyruvate dehydrogenase E2 component (dihydrolipoamide acetyltransferase)